MDPHNTRPTDHSAAVSRQFSLAEVLLLVVLSAVWFSIYRLYEPLALLSFAALLCVVTTILYRWDRNGTKTKTWKLLPVMGSWFLLYWLSAGPIIYCAKEKVHHNFLTTIYPYVEAIEIPVHRQTPTSGTVRYRLRSTNQSLRHCFEPWWD